MTASTPVERVAAMLARAPFRRLGPVLEVAGVKIEVADSYVGERGAPDLVLVGDTVQDTPRRLQQVVEGVARSLDIVASRRPLTLILVGPRPSVEQLRAMARYARVLPVGETADQESLQNWLAALLPLDLPQVDLARGESISATLKGAASAPLSQALVAAAREGPSAVAEVLHAAIEAPFEALEDAEEETAAP